MMRRGLIVALMCIGGCDIPTELPRLNPTFALRLPSTTISTAQFLPSSVVAGDSMFGLSFQTVTTRAGLVAFCPACLALHGQTVPKPAFNGSTQATVPLPPDLMTATLNRGFVHVVASHNFGFDPLRPGGGASGSLILSALSNGVVIGTAAVSGADRGFPSGSVLVLEIPITGVVRDSILLRIELASPAGGVARIDATSELVITTNFPATTASSVTVRISGRQVTGQPIQINLTGIDPFVINRVQGGMLLLDVTNPFGVGGTMTVSIAGGLTSIVKTVTLNSGDARIEIPLSENELRSILGQVVTVTAAGSVSSAGGVTVTPASAFIIDPLLVLELGPRD